MANTRKENLRLLQLAMEGKLTKDDLLGSGMPTITMWQEEGPEHMVCFYSTSPTAKVGDKVTNEQYRTPNEKNGGMFVTLNLD